jgi:hypothetical protein
MQINSLVGLSKVFSAFVKAGLSLPDSFSGARSLPLLVFVVAVFYFGLGRRKVGRQDAYCEGGEPKDRTLGLLVFLGVPVLAYAAAVVLSMRNSLLVPHSLVTVSPCVLLAVSHALSRLSPLQAGHPRATQIATGGSRHLFCWSSAFLVWESEI